MSDNLLLLTATITPPKGVPSLARLDPDQRRVDYLRAFRFYLDMLGRPLDRIVFVENSASDLADFARVAHEVGAQDRVEFVSFYGLDYPSGYGRAYGEFMLFDHAADHSETLRGAGDDAIVWKMTGRYLTRNLPEIIATRPQTFDLYCNLRDYPARLADMYLLAWNRSGYQNIIKGLAPRLREDIRGGFSEQVFRREVDDARRRCKVVPRFRQVPYIDGIRGYDNRNYTQQEGRAKLIARRVALRIAPWSWI